MKTIRFTASTPPYYAGDIATFPDAEASVYVGRGVAEPIEAAEPTAPAKPEQPAKPNKRK